MKLHDVTIVHQDGKRTNLPALATLSGCRVFATRRKAADPTVIEVVIT